MLSKKAYTIVMFLFVIWTAICLLIGCEESPKLKKQLATIYNPEYIKDTNKRQIKILSSTEEMEKFIETVDNNNCEILSISESRNTWTVLFICKKNP